MSPLPSQLSSPLTSPLSSPSTPTAGAERLALRVTQIRLEAERIASYDLCATDGALLPTFAPGAHIDVFMPEGLTRSYSLCGDPCDRKRYRIAVQLESDSRGGSAWMHTAPRVGDILQTSPPASDFSFAADAAHSVFICGGIGITPIVPMLLELNRRGSRWVLHYAAQNRERAAFLELLAELAGAHGEIRLCLASERAPGAGLGRLDLARLVADAPPEAHLYCCGPGTMIAEFSAACSNRLPGQVHIERFSASSEAANTGGFDVALKRSGKTIAVKPGQTILDALLSADVGIQYACSEGVCGTCRTTVLDGIPDHRDDVLNDDERRSNQSIMVCCSGSLSKLLVLDL